MKTRFLIFLLTSIINISFLHADDEITADSLIKARAAAFKSLIQALPKELKDDQNMSIRVKAHPSEHALLARELKAIDERFVVQQKQVTKGEEGAESRPKKEEKPKRLIYMNVAVTRCESGSALAYGNWGQGPDEWIMYSINLKNEKDKWTCESIKVRAVP